MIYTADYILRSVLSDQQFYSANSEMTSFYFDTILDMRRSSKCPHRLNLLNCSIFYYLAFNPLVTNELSLQNQLDESIFIYRGVRSKFSTLFHFSHTFTILVPVELRFTPI